MKLTFASLNMEYFILIKVFLPPGRMVIKREVPILASQINGILNVGGGEMRHDETMKKKNHAHTIH